MSAGDLPAWLEMIPPADVEAFSGGYESFSRQPAVGTTPALIVVDMTWEFVDDAFPTGFGQTGWPAVEQTAKLLQAARQTDIPVFYTKAFADPDYTPTKAQRGLWKPSQTYHLADDPSRKPGDSIVPQLEPEPDEIVICKQGKASGFFGTTLAADLFAERVDSVFVAGMTTSGCVRATAMDAFQYNFNVLLVSDACADRSQVSHAATLFDMQMKYADVLTTEAALQLM